MKLSEVGEFGLINRVRALLGEPPEGEFWVGDDAAVIRAPAGTLLYTTDLMIEGVHFDLELTGPTDLGYKALAVNISDVAAMGGTPRRALASIGIRPGIEVGWIEDLYRGMRECADDYGAAIVGGDISRSDCLVISVALIGNPAGRRVIHRNGARSGDLICVTGVLGASAAGYRLLRAGFSQRPDLTRAHLRPSPRVKEVEVLRRHIPTAMIDISDGFAADLGHICDESEVGARVDAARLPLVDLTGSELDREALELAIAGGEDYELCFTIPPERCEPAAREVEAETGTVVSTIGEIIPREGGRKLIVDGREEPLEASGWDHLKQ